MGGLQWLVLARSSLARPDEEHPMRYPIRRTATLNALILTALALVVPALVAVGVPASWAATGATTITVDGTKGGRTFDGVGAISGGGGNSRLLADYREP